MKKILERAFKIAPPETGSQSGVVKPLPLVRTPEGYVAIVGAIALIIAAPFFAQSDNWMGQFSNAGLFAMAAIGLGLLSGYAGQISLGHAAFLTIGAYSAAYFGVDRGLAFPLWLLLAGLVGAAIGLVVGLFSLRLRGDYLVIITLALVFVIFHVSKNWESVTGGNNGVSAGLASLNIGPIDFKNLSVFGRELTKNQGIFWLAWIMVGITALLARNIVRSRGGRALQAIRDRDIASEVIGIDTTRNKIYVFVLSSAIASMAGGVLAVQRGHISPPLGAPDEIFISIQFLAIIVVGGLGTVYGPILGALFIYPLKIMLEEIIEIVVDLLESIWPYAADKLLSFISNESGAIISTSAFSAIIYAILLILFLIFQPTGIAGLIRKAQIGTRVQIAKHKAKA